MIVSENKLILLEEIKNRLIEHQKTVSTAESCTSGLLAANLTYLEGSSSYYMGGVCSYSNFSKVHFLGVDSNTLKTYGAVSSETALQMANGIRKELSTSYGLSITGIAGPTGGSNLKPVGTVWVAIVSEYDQIVENLNIKEGDRNSIREKSVEMILEKFLDFIKSNK